MTKAKNIVDSVYGSLIGAAIGDALGAPVEGWQYYDIRKKYGKVTTFMPYTVPDSKRTPRAAGMVTDDTNLRQYISLAIVRKQGRVMPDDVAAVYREKMNLDRFWDNEHIMMHKLNSSLSPWDLGKGSLPAGCAIMGISPIGIINAGNPEQAYQDAFNVAFINQDNENRDAAATYAAGVAAAFQPDATVSSILETMRKYSEFLVTRALDFALELARKSKDVDEFVSLFYEKRLDWTSPLPEEMWNTETSPSISAIEILPATAGLFYLLDGDVNQCIIEGASFGRDCDTIAGVIGGLAGALQGAAKIRKSWISQCEKANEDIFLELSDNKSCNFFYMAQRLVEALESELKSTKARADKLKTILDTQC